MAFITADRIKETTTVTGTGPITLLGAVSGYRSFASVMLSIGDTCPYAIVNANASQWEVGIATYTAANTLTRTTIHASTADPDTDPVDFTAGVKDVFLAPTARTVLSDITSNDGTVTLTKVGPIVDLSVAIAAATENVIVQVRNTTGATLTKGTVVYINDALGQLPTVAKALATSDATSAQTLGMISADLGDNDNGYVTIIGLIDDISLDTGIYNDGDQLYLSGTTAGAFTNVKPYAPTHLVYVGVVEHAHVTQGKIFVKVQNGYELDELHNVSAQSPSNGQTIVYNSTNQLWEKDYVSRTNSLSAVPVVSGAGNSLTLAAGSGVGTGAGGSLVLQAGIQATSGGDGKVVVKQVAGQTSNLQEWQDSSAGIKAFVDSSGNIATGLNAYSNRLYIGPSATSYLTGGSQSMGLLMTGNQQLSIYAGPTEATRFSANSVLIRSGHTISWCSNIAAGSVNATITSDGAATLAQRNGTNPQSFRIYNTYTDASNYERAEITWTSNVCNIGIANAGTGTARRLGIGSGAGVPININSNMELQSGSLVFRWYNGSTIGVGPSFSDIYFTNPNNFVSVRNGTIGQKFGVYNTFTDVNNYERLAATWASNVCTIGLEQAGTGSTRNLVVAGANATTGAGGNVTITAGNGSGVGAGGNIILQPGAQGTSGGNGKVLFYSSAGAQTGYWDTNSSILYGGDTLSINSKLRINGAGYIMPFGTGIVISTGNSAERYIVTIPDQYGFKMNRNGLFGFSNDVWGSNWTSAATDSGIGRADFGVTCVIRDTSKNGGSLSFPSTTTAFSANTNDLVLTASAFQRINCTAVSSLTGIAPPTSGTHVDGRMIRVYNVGTANLTLSHNSTASVTPANRFYNATGADIILAPNDYAELIYDSTNNGSGNAGWRVS